MKWSITKNVLCFEKAADIIVPPRSKEFPIY